MKQIRILILYSCLRIHFTNYGENRYLCLGIKRVRILLYCSKQLMIFMSHIRLYTFPTEVSSFAVSSNSVSAISILHVQKLKHCTSVGKISNLPQSFCYIWSSACRHRLGPQGTNFGQYAQNVFLAKFVFYFWVYTALLILALLVFYFEYFKT